MLYAIIMNEIKQVTKTLVLYTGIKNMSRREMLDQEPKQKILLIYWVKDTKERTKEYCRENQTGL